MIELFTVTLTRAENSKPWNCGIKYYIDAVGVAGVGAPGGSEVRMTYGTVKVNESPAEIKTAIDAERAAWLLALGDPT